MIRSSAEEQFKRPGRVQAIERILGCTGRREGAVITAKPRFVSMKLLASIMDIVWVGDVEFELVADVEESWDGEPYDTRLEVRVIMQEIEE